MSVFKVILDYFNTEQKIKLFQKNDYIALKMITNKDIWDKIEFYNYKNNKNIINIISKINNCPKKIICVASSRIKLNFDKYNLSRLIELNLSNCNYLKS